ncbi:MAG: glutathione S-transferase [Alphaproteobacteria bacterium]|jgi:glutathione S-transferase|nr:glutathione S-transferase [Alphaproteobacteria bacterium]
MTLHLYYHPFSSYCQKVMIALHERGLPYERNVVDLGNERSKAEFATIWPYAKFPVLNDDHARVTLPESSVIIEYLDTLSASGKRMTPIDPTHLRAVHLLDRVIDNYVQTPMQKIVADRLRPEGKRDPHGVEEARALLETSYAFLEARIIQSYLSGPDVTLADCAAAPALFYAQKVAPFADRYSLLGAYLERMLDRPSFARCVEEARPFREFFPSAETDADWPESSGRTAF